MIDLLIRGGHRHIELGRETPFRVHPSNGGRRGAIRYEERRHVPSFELVDHLSESTVQGRLAREADRDVRRMPGLEEPFAGDVRVPLETAQQLPLGPDRILDDEAGVVRKEHGI